MARGLVSKIWRFYADGFRNMTWGRELWFLIILKLIILFVILRLFFFRPAMAGKTPEEKSETVGNVLTGKTPANEVHKDIYLDINLK